MNVSPLMIKNAEIFDGTNFIGRKDILIKDGLITSICDNINDFSGETINADGTTVIPGFIDLHIHGAYGFDTMDATVKSIYGMAKKLVEHGVTSFTPTTITTSNENTQASLCAIKEFIEEGRDDCAQVLGAHLEGPFLNPAKKAAMNPCYIQKPSIGNYIKTVGEYTKDVCKSRGACAGKCYA